MSNTVLYISYDGATDPLGQSQVIPYLCKLSGLGYNITLLTCEKKKNYKRHCEEVKKTLNQSKIRWKCVFFKSYPPIIAPLFNLLSLHIAAKKIVKNNKTSLVHCRSYIPALIGLSLKRKYGCKFVFDMRGFWADERIEGKIWNKNNPIHKVLYRFFKAKELRFLREADYTIVLTQQAKEEILSWKALQLSNIEIIPCCVDLEHFSKNAIKEEKLKQLKSKLQITENDFVITYIGSIGTWYMLDEMLDFFKQLLTKKTNAKFLFITPDNKSDILEKAELKNIDTDKIIVAGADRADVPYYIAIGNISVFFIKSSYSKKASSPTKMAEIMGMGVPLICNSGIGDIDRHIVSGKNGYIIEHFTTADYQKAIDNMDTLIAIDKQCVRETAQQYYSIDKGVDLYATVYKKLLNG